MRGKECVISIEARGSPLLDEEGLEGVPDQKRVVFTVLMSNLSSWEMAVLRAPQALSALISHF